MSKIISLLKYFSLKLLLINFFACILLCQIYGGIDEDIFNIYNSKDLIELKQNGKVQRLKYHPDKQGGSTEGFNKINGAYEFSENVFKEYNKNPVTIAEKLEISVEKFFKQKANILEKKYNSNFKSNDSAGKKYSNYKDDYTNTKNQKNNKKDSNSDDNGYTNSDYKDDYTQEKIENNNGIHIFRSYLLAIDNLVRRNNFASEIMHRNNSSTKGRFDCGFSILKFNDVNPIFQFSNVIPFISYNKKGEIQNINSYYEVGISAMLLNSKKNIPGYKNTSIGILHANIALKNNAILQKNISLSFQPKILYNINTKELFDSEFLTSFEVELLPFASVLLGYNIRQPYNYNYAKLGLRLYKHNSSLLLYAQSSNFADFNNPKFLKEIKKQQNSSIVENKFEEKEKPNIFSSLIGIEAKLHLDDINLLAFGTIGSNSDVVNLNSSDLTIIKSFGYSLGCTIELADKDSAFFSVSLGFRSDSSLAKGKVETLLDNYQFQDSTNYMNSTFISLNLNLNL